MKRKIFQKPTVNMVSMKGDNALMVSSEYTGGDPNATGRAKGATFSVGTFDGLSTGNINGTPASTAPHLDF